MARIVLTEKLARAAAQDAGNRNMRKHGRTKWNSSDWNVAAKEYTRLWGKKNPGKPGPFGSAARLVTGVAGKAGRITKPLKSNPGRVMATVNILRRSEPSLGEFNGKVYLLHFASTGIQGVPLKKKSAWGDSEVSYTPDLEWGRAHASRVHGTQIISVPWAGGRHEFLVYGNDIFKLLEPKAEKIKKPAKAKKIPQHKGWYYAKRDTPNGKQFLAAETIGALDWDHADLSGKTKAEIIRRIDSWLELQKEIKGNPKHRRKSTSPGPFGSAARLVTGVTGKASTITRPFEQAAGAAMGILGKADRKLGKALRGNPTEADIAYQNGDFWVLKEKGKKAGQFTIYKDGATHATGVGEAYKDLSIAKARVDYLAKRHNEKPNPKSPWTKNLTLKKDLTFYADQMNDLTQVRKKTGDKVQVTYSKGIGYATAYAFAYGKVFSSAMQSAEGKQVFKNWPKEWESEVENPDRATDTPSYKKGVAAGKRYAQRLNKAVGVIDPLKLAKSQAKVGVRRMGTLEQKLSFESGFMDGFKKEFQEGMLFYGVTKERPNPDHGDSVSARQLSLFIENDYQLHRSLEQPIQKNLINKMAKGVYKHAGAVKLYGYLMESGAKKYIKEHGSPGDQWHQMFPPAVRKEAAEGFAQSFETEAKLGNYDRMLQKQYQGKWSGKQQNPVGEDWPHFTDMAYRAGKETGTKDKGVRLHRYSNSAFKYFVTSLRKRGLVKGKIEKDVEKRMEQHFLEGYKETRGNPNPRKRNSASGAASMYESFHGTPSTEELVFKDADHYHGNLAALGPLVSLKVRTVLGDTATLEFELDKESEIVHTCTNEDGTHLYFVGGDQELDLAALGFKDSRWLKDKMVIGDIKVLTYRAKKSFDSFKTIDYYHKLSEDTGGPVPQLVYDRLNSRLEAVGGQYHILQPAFGRTSPGIEN